MSARASRRRRLAAALVGVVLVGVLSAAPVVRTRGGGMPARAAAADEQAGEHARRHDWHYRGDAAPDVRWLLGRATGWRLPSCDSCLDGRTPDLRLSAAVRMESRVVSAAQHAWAAEAHAVAGRTLLAGREAECARRILQLGDDRCPSALPGLPAAGGEEVAEPGAASVAAREPPCYVHVERYLALRRRRECP
ncbi:hypothetical protein [Roseisolibacter sp. H3M3-2]|uniref:hypothetical protein n=1 Tax=Roseisolibacter sp. H3M3-2 TaxID=3031323 RepID=UPI0023DBC1C5|nr:hypothetical protein [Roseisolibacter sp. H3M3-2]MDF1502432.1 hypothetical protein [Roseisolibacter sp. H3M3-2]